MNWKKLKENYPNIYNDIRVIEKENIHTTSKELLEIFLKRNDIVCNFLHYGLKEAENKKNKP